MKVEEGILTSGQGSRVEKEGRKVTEEKRIGSKLNYVQVWKSPSDTH